MGISEDLTNGFSKDGNTIRDVSREVCRKIEFFDLKTEVNMENTTLKKEINPKNKNNLSL